MFEWTPVTRSDYLNLWMIDLQWEYQQQMKSLVFEYFNRDVILTPINTSSGIRTVPFPSYINIIELNLKNLVGTDLHPDMEPTVTWRGGNLDPIRLDFQDVNRWFRTLQLLYQIIPIEQGLVTGDWQTGDFLTVQTWRKGSLI